MKKNLIALILTSLCSATQAESTNVVKPETPAECKARVGSLKQCFVTGVISGLEQVGLMRDSTRRIDQLRTELASMGKVGRESPMDMAQYGEIVKTATRPNYTALMASYAKNPEAAAATKKVMLAFIAVLNNATDSIGLKNNLQTALAELELVAP